MRAIDENDLGVLLGRLAGRDQPVAQPGVRNVVRRWAALGLAESAGILVGAPKVVTLTPQGAALVRPGARYSAPAWTQLTHTMEVGRVRLHLEHRYGDRLEWISESQWKSEHDAQVKQGRHVPDGVAVVDGQRSYVIEVELTAKSADRLRGVLNGVMAMGSPPYDRAVYYCGSDAIRRAVEEALEQARKTFGVMGLSGKPVPVDVNLLPSLRPAVAA